ncbi:MAG: hypothetical protein MJ016_01120 [Victivallaceae bacterium]|nr:hypothetical protein [Victivallaceae bacterium]
MNILTKQEADILKQAKAEFTKTIENRLESLQATDSQPLKEKANCVQTAIDAFGSETFIVSCVGMLKSGKSTLVNLFARNACASPTGYGFDTTLRPALITECAESEGCIEVWLPTGESEKLEKSVFDHLFNHLRGVAGTNNSSGVSCHSYPLTERNLFNALCKEVLEAEDNMLPTEPVLVVVKVPRREDSLLSSEIMILDTPGLDSGLSEWTNDDSERYSWIIGNSDLLLFLQSSVAPLNQKATKILKDIREKNKSVPVWLVQNEMLSKHWLPAERIQETTEQQRKRASEMFNRISRVFKQINANLGKADSALLDETLPPELREQLLSESQFPSMEKNIREDLKANIGPIRRGNCRNNVENELKKMRTLIGEKQADADGETTTLERTIAAMKNFKECVREILLDPPQEQSFSAVQNASEIQMLSTAPFNRQEFINLLRDVVDFDFKEEMYSCKDAKKIIEAAKQKLIAKMKDALRRTTLEDFSLSLHCGEERKNNIAKYLKEKFGVFTENLVNANYSPRETFRNEMKRLLTETANEVSLPDFPVGINIDINRLDRIQIEVEKLPAIRNKIWEWKKRTARDVKILFLRYYDARKQDGAFMNLIDQCEDALKENLCQWLNHDAFESMRAAFIRKIGEKIDAAVARESQTLENWQNDGQLLETMKTMCNKLQKKMEDF